MNLIIMAISLLSAIVALCAFALYRKHNKNVRLMANAANQPGAGVSLNGQRTFTAYDATSFTAFAAAYTNSFQPPGRFALVKAGTDANSVTVSSGAGDKILGVATDVPDAAGDAINVRLLNAPGTCLMVAAGTITAADFVQSNGDGAIKTATTGGYVIGIALQAAGAAGDVIEVETCISHAVL